MESGLATLDQPGGGSGATAAIGWSRAARRWAAVGVLLMLAGVYAWGLTGRAKLDEHECLVAETAREMLDSGDWLVPHFAGLVRLQKTPLPYWLVALLGWAAGGIDEWVVRLPSALAALGTAAACWDLGRHLFGKRVGWVAAVVAACSTGMLVYGHDGTADMLLTCLCAWCFAFFWRSQHARSELESRLFAYGFWVVLALAMLAKGPMPGPVVVLPVALFLVWQRDRTAWRRLRIGAGAVIFCAMLLPWVVYVITHVDAVALRWKAEFLDRFTGELRHSRQGKFFYYLPYLFGLCVPWALSVPEALAAPFLPRYRSRREGLWYVWLWVVVNLLFFSVAAFKRPHYILPAIPGMTLLLAVVLDRLFFGADPVNRRLVRLTCGSIVAALAVGFAAGLWFISRYHRDLLVPGVVAGAVALTGFSLAAWSYSAGYRGSSFLSIGLTGALAYAVLWAGLGPRFTDNSDALRLAEAIERHVPPAADLRWAGRQDARVIFYGRRLIRRFVDPMALLEAFADRPRNLPAVLYWIGRKMDERFRSGRPIYVVMDEEYYQLLINARKTPARVVAEVDHYGSDGRQTMVVATNARLESLR